MKAVIVTPSDQSEDEANNEILRKMNDDSGNFGPISKKGKQTFDEARLHMMLRDESGQEKDFDLDEEWENLKAMNLRKYRYGSAATIEAFDEALDGHVALFKPKTPPTPKGTGKKFTPKKKKRK